MADSRTYVRLHDGLPENPKIIEVGGEAAWLYVSAICYASRQLTDGVIPARMVRRLTDLANPEALASLLLQAGLFHEADHDCPRCPAIEPGEYVVHDYLSHQRSADDVRSMREKRAAAGQKGGRRSGESRRAARDEAKDEALASPLLEPDSSKTQPVSVSVSESEEEKKKATSPPLETPPRADVERVCKHLADKLAATGSKRPTITKAWRDSARLLLDRDGVTVDQAIRAIDWAHADSFWQAHILTPKKLREKYDTLRRQAVARQNRAPQAAPQPDPDDMTEEEINALLRFSS